MEGFFTVTILRGQRRAKDDNGVIYPIHGLEIIAQDPPYRRTVYLPRHVMYKAAAAVGTRSKCYVHEDGRLMLR